MPKWHSFGRARPCIKCAPYNSDQKMHTKIQKTILAIKIENCFLNRNIGKNQNFAE